MRHLVVLLPLLLCIGSCGSPPKPPIVDEARKRPVNTPSAVELQTCRSDLQNTRILASECGHEVASVRAWAMLRASASTVPGDLRPAESRNAVYSILFAFGSTRPALAPIELTRLVDEARRSPWIQLSGRTDGSTESPAESKVARERAEAVRDLLVRNGIEPAKIRATWQPIGDPAAANDSESGRSLNRRVEIELYRVAPRHLSLSTPSVPDES